MLDVDSTQKHILILSREPHGEVVAVIRRYDPTAILQESYMVQNLSRVYDVYGTNLQKNQVRGKLQKGSILIYKVIGNKVEFYEPNGSVLVGYLKLDNRANLVVDGKFIHDAGIVLENYVRCFRRLP